MLNAITVQLWRNGTPYTVWEGYVHELTGFVNEKYYEQEETVETTDGSQTTFVLNNHMKLTSLSVSKTVTGGMGDKVRDFHFKLVLSGRDNLPNSLIYTMGEETGSVKAKNGVIEFTLAHGETINFGEVPIGLSYEAVETDGESKGDKVEATNSSAILTEEADSVSFINTKDSTVPTSADTNIKNFLPFLLLTVFCMAWMVWSIIHIFFEKLLY